MDIETLKLPAEVVSTEPLPTMTGAEWLYADNQRRIEATAFGEKDLEARSKALDYSERRLAADAELRAAQDRISAASQAQAVAQTLVAKNMLLPTPEAPRTRRQEYMQFLLAFAPGRTAEEAHAQADLAYSKFREKYPPSTTF